MEDELVDPDPRSPADALNQARSKNQDVRSALQRCADLFCVLTYANLLLFLVDRSDAAGALATALSDPPYGTANAEASVRATLP